MADVCPYCKSGKTSVLTWSAGGQPNERSVHQCEACNRGWTVHWRQGYPHDIHPGQEYIKPLAEALLDGATTVSEAVKTVVGYKIFHVRKDGTIGPLFINRKQVVPQGEWLPAEDPGPQRGYQHRPGWHAAPKPEAPHLMTKSGKLATDRRWYKVHLRDAEKIKRPKAQGGHWYLAKQMKVVGPVD